MDRVNKFNSCRVMIIVTLFSFLVLTDITAAFDYGDALDKSLLFFEAQRSGKLPYNHQAKWRGDSGMRDGFAEGVDLVGGYYDAGDHVKFGLPMGYSVTMLSWAALDFSKDIVASNQMAHTLSAIKWGTDYFLKAHTYPNVLWAQVGDGDSDHFCWERAEDMSTSRTAYKIDTANPGSDLAAETAAALASASLAFLPFNSSYSQLLVQHAEQLFSFADTFRGSYDDSITNAKSFYDSSGYTDELLWAAAWLYRATKKEYYLKYVVENADSMGGTGWSVTEFSWDNKYAGLQILLSKVLLEGKCGDQYYTSILNQYKAKADLFACSCLQKNNGYNVERTPGGLVYVRQWNNMQYASSSAFLISVYSQYLSESTAVISCPQGTINPQDLLNFAKSQADYILGENPKSMSYLVGYGSNYPVRVHHRGSSIASISVLNSVVGCVDGFESWYNRPEPNPNVIYGGLVGGPDKYDNYNDVRTSYEQTEPTLSGTAPLVGLFAKLRGSSPNSSPSYGPPTSYASPSPYDQPKQSPTYYQQAPSYSGVKEAPIKFIHSITNSWTYEGQTSYRHKVVVKNTSTKSIEGLKLKIENLSGPIYGLVRTNENNIYEVPPYLKVLKAGLDFSFVYIQGGPQAKISVSGYH